MDVADARLRVERLLRQHAEIRDAVRSEEELFALRGLRLGDCGAGGEHPEGRHDEYNSDNHHTTSAHHHAPPFSCKRQPDAG